MSDFISKTANSSVTSIYPFLKCINSIQNLQNMLDQKTANAINKYENLIPDGNPLNIGSQTNMFSSGFLSDSVFVSNITSNILTINADTIILNSNDFVRNNANLHFKKRLIVNGFVNIQQSSGTSATIRTKTPIFIINQNTDDIIEIRRNDSGKSILISENAHNKCIKINVNDYIESMIYTSKNMYDNYGIGFDMRIMTDSIDDSNLKIGFDDPRNVVGYVENVGDKSLKYINSSYGLVITNYKIGDTIECVLSENMWIFTGNVYDKDSVIMAENPITTI